MARASLDQTDAHACPDDAQLAALLESSAEDSDIEQHLGNCASCQQRLERLAGELGVGHALTEPLAPPSEALETAMRSLKAHPLEVRQDLSSWLASVGGTEAVGELLGRLEGYELRRVINEGGMGIVLEARDPRLDRVVAIKLIKPSLVASKAARERLLREAKTAASIQHDHIVPIYAAELTTVGHVPFIVMPYVASGTLQDLLDQCQAPLSLSDLLPMGEQMADALAAAHSVGLLHRDVKPANVLVRDEHQLWMADFGIARAKSGDLEQDRGEISGTPQFMAPEQLDGQPSDHRADLFSLGAVLYVMATGKLAFPTDSLHPHEATAEANPELPAWLSGLIDSLLEKDPNERPQSAKGVRDRIRTANTASSTARSLKVPFIAIAALCLVALGFLWFQQQTAWKKAPFRLPNQKVGYHSFLQALKEAPPGAIIECQRSGLIYSGTLPPIEKALWLRATNGATPRVEGVIGMKPLIDTKAPLAIEGFHLTIDCNDRIEDSGSPPLITTSAPLMITNSVLVHAHNREVSGPYRASLVRLENAGKAVFHNTLFVNRARAAISFGGEQNEITLKNCFTVSRTALLPKQGTANQVSISANQCSFHARELLFWRQQLPLSPAELDLQRCIVSMDFGVMSLPGRRPSDVHETVRYSGEGNVHDKDSLGFIGFVPPQRALNQNELPRISRLDDWLRFWEMDPTQETLGEVSLSKEVLEELHQDTGKVHPRELVPEALSDQSSVGVDPSLLGTGEALQSAVHTPAHALWTAEVQKQFMPSRPR